jgi:hypothetical protein
MEINVKKKHAANKRIKNSYIINAISNKVLVSKYLWNKVKIIAFNVKNISYNSKLFN